jgi:hypothetical protein
MEEHEIDGVLYEGFCAENVKFAIEKIVNKYKFAKSKIRGIIKMPQINNRSLTNEG